MPNAFEEAWGGVFLGPKVGSLGLEHVAFFRRGIFDQELNTCTYRTTSRTCEKVQGS